MEYSAKYHLIGGIDTFNGLLKEHKEDHEYNFNAENDESALNLAKDYTNSLIKNRISFDWNLPRIESKHLKINSNLYYPQVKLTQILREDNTEVEFESDDPFPIIIRSLSHKK